jgi:glyoxylase-like metal-dependent hydrolase (beta-lactamase superfamily II)
MMLSKLKNKKVKYFQVAQGVWGLKILFVNIYMIANRKGQAKGWVLVDTGLIGSAKKIIAMAEKLFGYGTKPAAIILTHGHSDHVGSLKKLLKYWDVPVYAHSLELPYLTGLSSYPPVDPTVGGGLMSLLSVFFPVKPIDIGNKVQAIDLYEGVPELPEWRIIHTPGHSPGHVSLFLPLNTTLIAGDAITTTKSESAIYVLSYLNLLSGPPKYITSDWQAAASSVRRLAALNPRIIATGHGPVMRGRELQTDIEELAENFEERAVPGSGRYVGDSAVADESGVKYIPPFKTNTRFNITAGIIAAMVTFIMVRKL